VLWTVLTVMISTWALLAARKVRKRRAAWVAAEVDALLREAAGGVLNHPGSRWPQSWRAASTWQQEEGVL